MRRLGRVTAIALLCGVTMGCSGESASTSPPAPVTSAAPYTTSATKVKARLHARRVTRRRARPASQRGVPAVDVPNPRLTPGAVLTTSAARVCKPGYSESVRDVPYSEKLAVYARYRIPYVAYKHEVDHLVSPPA